MPHRVNPFLLAVLGILGLGLVLALVLIGRDPRRSARTGPTWKRRLLTAALALLASGGLATSTNCIFTCYEPAPGAFMERDDFLNKAGHLAAQLPLLEKFAAEEKLDPNVVGRVWVTARNDVHLLETEFARRRLSAEEYARSQDLCRRAKASLDSLAKRLGETELRRAEMAEWEERRAATIASRSATRPAGSTTPAGPAPGRPVGTDGAEHNHK